MDTSSINSILNTYTQDTSSVSSSALQSKLESMRGQEQTDEDLMKVAKEFESYLLEQVFKDVKKSMMSLTGKEEEENKYLQYFGDYALQEMMPDMAEHADIGLAQQLYEAMKRNSGPTSFAELEARKAAREQSEGLAANAVEQAAEAIAPTMKKGAAESIGQVETPTDTDKVKPTTQA